MSEIKNQKNEEINLDEAFLRTADEPIKQLKEIRQPIRDNINSLKKLPSTSGFPQEITESIIDSFEQDLNNQQSPKLSTEIDKIQSFKNQVNETMTSMENKYEKSKDYKNLEAKLELFSNTKVAGRIASEFGRAVINVVKFNFTDARDNLSRMGTRNKEARNYKRRINKKISEKNNYKTNVLPKLTSLKENIAKSEDLIEQLKTNITESNIYNNSTEKAQKAEKYINNMNNFLESDVVKEALGNNYEGIKNAFDKNIEKASNINDIKEKIELSEVIRNDIEQKLNTISSPEKQESINYIKAYNQAKFQGVNSKLISELPEDQKFSKEIADEFIKSLKEQSLKSPVISTPEIPPKPAIEDFKQVGEIRTKPEVKLQESPEEFIPADIPKSSSRSSEQKIIAEGKMSQHRKEPEIVPVEKGYFEKEMNKMVDKGLKNIDSPSLADKLKSMQQNIDSMIEANSNKNRIDKRFDEQDLDYLIYHVMTHTKDHITSPYKDSTIPPGEEQYSLDLTAEEKLDLIMNSDEAAEAKKGYSDLIKSAQDAGDLKKADVAKYIKTSIEYQIAKVAGKEKDYLDELKQEDLPSKHIVDTMISITKGERKEKQKDIRKASKSDSSLQKKPKISKKIAKKATEIGQNIPQVDTKEKSSNIPVANQSRGRGL